MALGGILLALCMVAVSLGSFVPGVDLTLLAASSVIIFVFCGLAGPVAGLIFYGAAVLLSFILVPDKTVVIPFALFFGLYPNVKYFLETAFGAPPGTLPFEKIPTAPPGAGKKAKETTGGSEGADPALRKKARLRWSLCLLIKLGYCVIVGVVALLVTKNLFINFTDSHFQNLPWIVLLLLGAVVFVAFDILLSACYAYCQRRFGSVMRSGGWNNFQKDDCQAEPPDIKLS